MADPRSLSVKELSAATQKAVARFVEQEHGKRLKPPYIFGFFPQWWCGFVVRNVDHELTHGETQRIAADVFKHIAGQVTGIDQGGKPGAQIDVFGGLTTIGFVPPPDVIIKE
jgi:transcription antitermination factor NusG